MDPEHVTVDLFPLFPWEEKPVALAGSRTFTPFVLYHPLPCSRTTRALPLSVEGRIQFWGIPYKGRRTRGGWPSAFFVPETLCQSKGLPAVWWITNSGLVDDYGVVANHSGF